jgi:pyruvate formate lyase activating enzyme
MTTGLVFDIKRFSIHDGPGIRTTVFLKGCPLHCSWCHNPESQDSKPDVMLRPGRCIACEACIEVCPEHAISACDDGTVVTDREKCVRCGTCTDTCYAEARQQVGEEITVAETLDRIELDRSFYEESGGGVTLSGGEPLLQRDFVRGVLKSCRERDIRTAVDTSGAVSWKALESVAPWTDLFLYDIKHMDDGAHRQTTGVSNRRILENLRRLSAAGQNINLRFAVIPGVNDSEQNIRETGRFAAALPQRHPLSILPYHAAAEDKYKRLNQSYTLGDINPPSDGRMAEIAALLGGYGLEVKTGG